MKNPAMRVDVSKMKRSSSFSADTIEQGMAYALWEHAFEHHQGHGAGGSLPLPPPAAADKAARDLAKLVVSLNGGESLASMMKDDGGKDAGDFGYRIALCALGVRWQRTHGQPIAAWMQVPTFEVEFDGKELTWEGSEKLRRNPFGYRIPTDEELASAWRYIENEYTLKEGNVDGEQWAEGLAFGRSMEGLAKVDPIWYRDLMAAARHARGQLSDDQWAMIAARADRLRADQGEITKFKTAAVTKNPDVEEDLGIDNPSRRMEWGFDLTDFHPGGWGKVLCELGIDPDPKVMPLYAGDPRMAGKYRTFLWTGRGIEIVTAHNPITGESGSIENGHREKNYAGYIGIRGTRAKVLEAKRLIKKHASMIKDETGTKGLDYIGFEENPHHRRQWLPSMVDDAPSHDWPRSEVQSLLFSVDHFTPSAAKEWAKAHGFRYGYVDTTERYHRLRQFDPTGAPCRTIELEGSHPLVKAVVCRAR